VVNERAFGGDLLFNGCVPKLDRHLVRRRQFRPFLCERVGDEFGERNVVSPGTLIGVLLKGCIQCDGCDVPDGDDHANDDDDGSDGPGHET